MSTLYSADQLDSVARETGFIQRKSKLSAQMYLNLLLFNVFDQGKISLNDHSMELLCEHRLQMRRQSIHERFNEASVAFVSSLLKQHWDSQIFQKCNMPTLEKFTAVMIKDSTRFKVPDHLKQFYPGNGGSGCAAGMHIQFEFDLCSGRINDLEVTDALHQDTTDALSKISQIKEGSLLLRDLGYFSTEVLEHIENAKAYYISRLNPQVNVYQLMEGKYVLVDLKPIYQQIKASGLSHKELDVYIGGKRKVPVRLIIEPLPENELARRMATAKRNACKQGRTLSSTYKAHAGLNMFVTNASKTMLPSDQVRTLYRLRWQIELRFKAWKSFCKIHMNKKMNVHRFRTYLHACLLFIFIGSEITSNLAAIVWEQKNISLSTLKCFKVIVAMHKQLKAALFKSGKLRSFLEYLYQLSERELLLEKRKIYDLKPQNILS